MTTPDLFPETNPPRQAPRKLMHARCGHESDWIDGLTVTEAKRGMSCPECNG